MLRAAWELSGVCGVCALALHRQLWRCHGAPSSCPSCVASGAAVAAGTQRAGFGDGPAHLRCRLLRARLFAPTFGAWWLMSVFVAGLRFNAVLGGSCIRPVQDAHYFLKVLQSTPFLAAATVVGTVAVLLMSELLDAENHPQVVAMLHRLALEMEHDEMARVQLEQRLNQRAKYATSIAADYRASYKTQHGAGYNHSHATPLHAGESSINFEDSEHRDFPDHHQPPPSLHPGSTTSQFPPAALPISTPGPGSTNGGRHFSEDLAAAASAAANAAAAQRAQQQMAATAAKPPLPVGLTPYSGTHRGAEGVVGGSGGGLIGRFASSPPPPPPNWNGAYEMSPPPPNLGGRPSPPPPGSSPGPMMMTMSGFERGHAVAGNVQVEVEFARRAAATEAQALEWALAQRASAAAASSGWSGSRPGSGNGGGGNSSMSRTEADIARQLHRRRHPSPSMGARGEGGTPPGSSSSSSAGGLMERRLSGGRGDGDVSHLISSDSDGDNSHSGFEDGNGDGSDSSAHHAASGFYRDLGEQISAAQQQQPHLGAGGGAPQPQQQRRSSLPPPPLSSYGGVSGSGGATSGGSHQPDILRGRSVSSLSSLSGDEPSHRRHTSHERRPSPLPPLSPTLSFNRSSSNGSNGGGGVESFSRRYGRGEGDVSDLISSDDEDDDDDVNGERKSVAPLPLSSPRLLPKGNQHHPNGSNFGNNSDSSSGAGSGSLLNARSSPPLSPPRTRNTSLERVSRATGAAAAGLQDYSPGSKAAAQEAAAAALGRLGNNAAMHAAATGKGPPGSHHHPLGRGSGDVSDLISSDSESDDGGGSSSGKSARARSATPPGSAPLPATTRGRPDTRGGSGAGGGEQSTSRGVSLTRSNADSSEDDEEEEEEEEEDAKREGSVMNGAAKANEAKGPLIARVGVEPPAGTSAPTMGAAPAVAVSELGKNAFPWTDDNEARDESPSSVIEPRQATASSSPPGSERASATVGTVATSTVSKTENRDGSSSARTTESGSAWAKFIDESSGVPYWFNEASGESMWAKPDSATA